MQRCVSSKTLSFAAAGCSVDLDHFLFLYVVVVVVVVVLPLLLSAAAAAPGAFGVEQVPNRRGDDSSSTSSSDENQGGPTAAASAARPSPPAASCLGVSSPGVAARVLGERQVRCGGGWRPSTIELFFTAEIRVWLAKVGLLF